MSNNVLWMGLVTLIGFPILGYFLSYGVDFTHVIEFLKLSSFTVIPVLKENIVNGYGDLSGDLGSRYAGFVECDGSSYQADRFPALWQVIKNTYGGNATYNGDTGDIADDSYNKFEEDI